MTTQTTDTSKPSPVQAIIRRLLERMSQGELARRSSIPQPRISRWAAGDVPESVDDVIRLQELDKELSTGDNQIHP